MMSIHILLLSNTDRFPYESLICFSDPELQPPPVRAIHTLEWPLFLQRDYERANQETNLQRHQCRSDPVERLVGRRVDGVKQHYFPLTTGRKISSYAFSATVRSSKIIQLRNSFFSEPVGGSWHTILTNFACENIRCDHCTTVSHSRAF